MTEIETRPQVDVVAFDVNDTLFSLDRLGAAFSAVGLDRTAGSLWFARVLRDGANLAVVGGYASFLEIAREQLRALGLADYAIATVVEAFHELEPFPDAEPALHELRDANVRAVTLTNGGPDRIGRLLDQAGVTVFPMTGERRSRHPTTTTPAASP